MRFYLFVVNKKGLIAFSESKFPNKNWFNCCAKG